MINRLILPLTASTLALVFVGAAAATHQVSGRTSPMAAQQAAFMPVPLCAPSAPSCPAGGPPEMPTATSR